MACRGAALRLQIMHSRTQQQLTTKQPTGSLGTHYVSLLQQRADEVLSTLLSSTGSWDSGGTRHNLVSNSHGDALIQPSA